LGDAPRSACLSPRLGFGGGSDLVESVGVHQLERAGVTRREREVLLLLGDRLTNAEIAERLFISVRTVESHVSALLVKLALSDRRALASTARQLAAPASTPGIPYPVTSFVGRRKELVELRAELVTTRLLLLTGSGGCGKSRLAMELVREEMAGYPGGVWYAELAPLSEPALVPQTVAAVLGLGGNRGWQPVNAMVGLIGSRDALLVLDNCEHLVEACAALASDLLEACANLEILATSRRVFGVGETVWPVPPLSLPTELPRELCEVLHSDAVDLFVERARRQRPGFALDETNREAVIELCHRLEGIPLAIELAAGLVGALSVRQIEARLGGSLDLLQGGRSVLPRHRTIRGTIDWSYGLLSATEQGLLRRLSVFRGGFTLEAAEAVCASEALDGLARLVESSLVETVEVGDDLRYRLLETIRLYSAQRLDAEEEAPAVLRLHRDWCLALAERAGPELRGPNQREWLRRLDLEHDNVRAAMSWSSQRQEIDVVLRFSLAMGWYWWVRGFFREGRDWLEQALRESADLDSAQRAEALRMAGTLASYDGDHEAAAVLFDETFALSRGLGDLLGEGKALNQLGVLAWEGGRLSEAWRLWSSSLASFVDLDDARGVAIAHNNLGLVAREQGRYAQARRHFDESIAIYRSLGDEQGVASDLSNLGQVSFEVDDFEDAGRLYDESLEIRLGIGHRHGIATTLALQGALQTVLGRFDEAQDLLERSSDVARAIGDRQRLAYAIAGVAEIERSLGQASEAIDLFSRALTMFTELGEPLGTAHAALGAGRSALQAGDHEEASHSLRQSLDQFRAMGHRKGIAAALQLSASIAYEAGDNSGAASLLGEALRGFAKLRGRIGTASCLDDCGDQLANAGRPELALTLWAAAAAERERIGISPPPCDRERVARQGSVALLSLGPSAAGPAEASGRSMSLDSAVSRALTVLEELSI
jgi:predicted ATPase/DNA-binding CsgD family transcriptional regulator